MKKLIYGALFLTLVGIGMISCKKDIAHLEKEENVYTDNISVNTKEAPGWKIRIERKKVWAIVWWSHQCDDGRGLCVSGGDQPDPIGPYYDAMLIQHPESESQLIFYFPIEYIEDEDELIEDGYFIIDFDIEIDEETSNLLGYEYPITIKAGSYIIEYTDEGYWHLVVVDIY